MSQDNQSEIVRPCLGKKITNKQTNALGYNYNILLREVNRFLSVLVIEITFLYKLEFIVREDSLGNEKILEDLWYTQIGCSVC